MQERESKPSEDEQDIIDSYTQNKASLKRDMYKYYPYLFKSEAPSGDTSSRKDCVIIVPTSSLVEQQFEKSEKVELIEKISTVVDKLIDKDIDFKVIKRQKLVDEMSDLFDDFTPEQMRSLSENEDEIYNRLEKIMALEAMIERLSKLHREERLRW